MRTILILSLALVAAWCGAHPSSSRLHVVAAENVYGDIAQQIGGNHIAVTSILNDPNADPHLFEPGTANGLAVANAKVVIANGVGYDSFIDRLEHASPQPDGRSSSSPSTRRPRAGCQPTPLVRRARAPPCLSGDRGRAGTGRPQARFGLGAGLRRFDASLAPLDQEVATLRRAYAGQPVAYTEPVPGYLLQAGDS